MFFSVFVIGFPPRAVKKSGRPHSSTICVSSPGALALRTAILGVSMGRVAPPALEVPVRRCHSRKKKKLSADSCFLAHFQPPKVQNTTHFRSRLYYVHPPQINTEKSGQPASWPGLRRDREAENRTSRQKQDRWQPYFVKMRKCVMCL